MHLVTDDGSYDQKAFYKVTNCFYSYSNLTTTSMNRENNFVMKLN